MNWTGPRELRAQLQRCWDRGELLTGLVSGESTFPRRLTLKGPTSAQMAEHFDTVRTWIARSGVLPEGPCALKALVRQRVLPQRMIQVTLPGQCLGQHAQPDGLSGQSKAFCGSRAQRMRLQAVHHPLAGGPALLIAPAPKTEIVPQFASDLWARA